MTFIPKHRSRNTEFRLATHPAAVPLSGQDCPVETADFKPAGQRPDIDPANEPSSELIDHFIIYASACMHKREISTADIGQADTAARFAPLPIVMMQARTEAVTKKWPIRKSGIGQLTGEVGCSVRPRPAVTTNPHSQPQERMFTEAAY